MKWIAADTTPIDDKWGPWHPVFAWWPVPVVDGYLMRRYWLCRIERRTRKFRGLLWPESIFTTHEYRPPTLSKDATP